MAGAKRGLSLVSSLTPEQQAERELQMLTSSPSESTEAKLLKEVFRRVVAMQAQIEALNARKKTDPEELVNARYVAERFGLRSNSKATDLMYRIGVVRVGPKGGALRVYLADVDRFEQNPDVYEQRPRSAAA